MDPRDRTCRWRGRSLIAGLVIGVLAGGLAVSATSAQSLFTDRTALIDVHGGSSLDGTVFALGTGTGPLAGGGTVNFRHWYTSRGQNVSATWITELRPDFGIYWGFQTGEHGQKFHIQPAVNLGFIWVDSLSEHSTLSFTVTGVAGGWLKESDCLPTYLTGTGMPLTTPANCRLAATEMNPTDTLKYLVNVPPPDWFVVGVRYTLRF